MDEQIPSDIQKIADNLTVMRLQEQVAKLRSRVSMKNEALNSYTEFYGRAAGLAGLPDDVLPSTEADQIILTKIAEHDEIERLRRALAERDAQLAEAQRERDELRGHVAIFDKLTRDQAKWVDDEIHCECGHLPTDHNAQGCHFTDCTCTVSFDSLLDTRAALRQQLAAATERERVLLAALALSSPWVGTDHMGEYFCMHCKAYMEDGHKSDCIYAQAERAAVEQAGNQLSGNSGEVREG